MSEGIVWDVTYRARSDFGDLIRDALAAKAALRDLSDQAKAQGAAETDAATKAAAAHRADAQAIDQERRSYEGLALAAKSANQQVLYGGRSDMGQHLSDLSQEQRWQELLLRQRNLGFSSVQAAFSWRQQELQQAYLANRAKFGATSSGTGFSSPNEYLSYLQRQLTADTAENQILLARAALYRQNADAALAYGNALSGQHKTLGTLGQASSQQLAGVQQFNAALVGLPDQVTTTLNVDDNEALRKIALYRTILAGMGHPIDTPVMLSLPDKEQVQGFVSHLPTVGTTQRVMTGGTNTSAGPPLAAGAGGAAGGGGGAAGIAAAGAAAGGAGDKARVAYGWFSLLTRELTLFGGLLGDSGVLGKIAVWHVVLDGIIEALAVLVPALGTAAAGLAAFGLAGLPAAEQLYTHLKSIYIVSQATNSVIPPMTDNFKKFQEAAKPQVLQLYGDALDVLNHSTGIFGNLALQTGSVVDKLAARLTVFLTSGGDGFKKFLETGGADLKLFSQLLASLGDIFANLLKATEITHIAEILLTFVGAVAQVVDWVTKLPAPVLAALLALHGFIVWGGLATTAILKVLDPIRGLAVALGGIKDISAVSKLGEGASGLDKLGATLKDIGAGFAALPGRLGLVSKAEEDAAGKTGVLSGAMDLLKGGAGKLVAALGTTGGIAGVVGVLVAAFVILGVTLGRTKDATDQWIASTDQAVSKANNWNAIPATLNAVYQSQQRIATASSAVGKAFQQTSAATGELKGRFGDFNGALTATGRDLENLQSANDRYSKQAQAQLDLVDKVSRKYGVDYVAAVGLATVAGVDLSKVTDENSKAFRIALQQIDGVVQGYKQMGQQGGMLKDDLNAVGLAAELQQTHVSDLNTAWDTFITLVTGGEQAFQKFGQDLNSLTTAAQAAGASFEGVDKASLTLQSGFTGAVQDGSKLLDAFRQQAAVMGDTNQATELLTRGGKDLIATLLPMAAQSKAARDQLFALAQDAGYGGVNSLKALTQWTGEQGATGAERDLSAVTAILAGKVSDLAKDYANLATILSSDVNNLIAQSIIQAEGGQTAFLKFAQGIKQGATSSQAFQDAGAQVIMMLLQQSGSSLPKAKAQFEAYAIQLGDTKGQADKLWDSLHGKVAVELANEQASTIPKAKNALVTFAEQGLNYSKTKANDLWSELTSKLGPQLSGLGDLASGKAKKQFVDWAENGLHLTQQQANNLWRELVTLQTKINDLHGKDVHVNFVGSGTGQIAFKESIPGVTTGPSSTGLLGFHATGGRIPGYNPGVDSQLAMVSPGEFVLVPEAAQALGYGQLEALNSRYAAGRKSGPFGFAGGGFVTGSTTGLFGSNGILSSGQPYMASTEASFGRAVEQAFATAVTAKFKQDMQAAQTAAMGTSLGAGIRSTALGGDEGANRALAQQMFPWPASMWPSYVALEMQEAGFNRFARNPSSGAYGIPQALPPTKMPFAAQAAGGSHAGPQIGWMYDYIRSVYGNPVNAEGHELAVRWYGAGGTVHPYFAAGGFVAPGFAPEWSTAAADLNTAARTELTNFWALMGKDLPKGATAAQHSTWNAWRKALTAQQLSTFGLGRHPAGAFAVLSGNLSHPSSSALPGQFSTFASRLGYLIKEQAGTGIPGGINPPGTPRDSGYVPWHYLHGPWQNLRDALVKVQQREQFAKQIWGNIYGPGHFPYEPGAHKPPASIPIQPGGSGALLNLQPLITGGPMTPVFGGLGGPDMGFASGGLAQVANMFSGGLPGFATGGMAGPVYAVPKAMQSAVPGAAGQYSRTVSEAARRTGIENLSITVNNPVPATTEQGVAHAANRAAFLAGRQLA